MKSKQNSRLLEAKLSKAKRKAKPLKMQKSMKNTKILSKNRKKSAFLCVLLLLVVFLRQKQTENETPFLCKKLSCNFQAETP